MSSNDVYAVTDLSKKNRQTAYENGPASEPDGITYDVLRRDNCDIKELQEQNLSERLHYQSKPGNIFSAHGLKIFILLIITWVILAVLIILIIVLFMKDSSGQVVTISNSDQLQENSSILQSFSPEVNETIFKNLASVNSSISDIYDILNRVNSNLSSVHKFRVDNYLTSCFHILSEDSAYPSGRYIVRSSTGELRSVYCEMNTTFGNNSFGWRRIAKLDTKNCPQGMKIYRYMNYTTCVVTEDDAGCTTITYSDHQIQYSKVAGRIRGYSIGTSDGFTLPRSSDITRNYVDGVQITSGDQHVWTFATGCTCPSARPSFVGNNYSCDRPESSCRPGQFCDTLLWESQKCGENPSPWFLRTLQPTTADFQVDICRNQRRRDEDLAIEELEIYVQ